MTRPINQIGNRQSRESRKVIWKKTMLNNRSWSLMDQQNQNSVVNDLQTYDPCLSSFFFVSYSTIKFHYIVMFYVLFGHGGRRLCDLYAGHKYQ